VVDLADSFGIIIWVEVMDIGFVVIWAVGRAASFSIVIIGWVVVMAAGIFFIGIISGVDTAGNFVGVIVCTVTTAADFVGIIV